MDDETWVRDATLGQFQQFFFRENYENGEPNTEIQIKADNKPPLLMVLNQKDNQNPVYFCEEKNTKESHTSFLKTWGGDKEGKTVDVEASDLYLSLLNLGSQPTSIKVTISRRHVSARHPQEYIQCHLKDPHGHPHRGHRAAGRLLDHHHDLQYTAVMQDARMQAASTQSPASPSTKRLRLLAADDAT
jgi:hypothetical protein